MNLGAKSQLRQRAFNLIELLVVIAIIAVLASLLLPALAGAKARAYVVQCKSNEKQLALAWYLYADDNNDRMVPNGYHDPTASDADTTRDYKLWVRGTSHKYNVPEQAPPFTNVDYLIKSEYAAFATYIPAPGVYKCPADHSQLNGEDKVRSYSLNGYMNWVKPMSDYQNSPGYKNFKKVSEVAAANPSGLMLFLDVAPNWICHSAFVTKMESSLVGNDYYHFPSTEHARIGVISFSDGHVDSQKWKDDYTTTGGRRSFDNHTHFDNISPNPDAPDLKWLRAHASVPLF